MTSSAPRRPFVRLTLSDGTSARVHPGQLIGRARTAALRIDDPRISEALAMVSLRGRALYLIALRGMLRGRSGPVTEVRLVRGARLELAPGLRVTVDEIVLPERMLAISGLGPAPQELVDSVHHICLKPQPLLGDGFLPDADVVIWSTADGWKFRLQGGLAEELVEGTRIVLGDRTLEVVGIDLDEIAVDPTRQGGGSRAPLRLVLRQETVHLQIGERPVVRISGISARIICEVARFDAPTPWDWVAREVWGDLDRETLRVRWDRNLRTARARIRQAGLPGDLVRADGHGNIELVLREGDQVIDEG